MKRPDVCPHVNPGISVTTCPGRYAFYCRLADGRIRMPSRDEQQRFCVSGHYQNCAGYRGGWRDVIFGDAGASR